MFKEIKKLLAGLAALAALALGGAAIAGAASSGSTSSTAPPSGATASGASPTPSGAPAGMPAPGTAAHEAAEKPVTGETAAKAQAAAVKAVGGGTAGAVTTDYTKTGYETTVTKSDGTKVEVHLDSSFNAMQAPGGAGGRPSGGPPAGVTPESG